MSSSAGDGSSAAEFVFTAQPSRRVRPRRAPQFSFTRATPAKRSRSRRDEGERPLALASDGAADKEEEDLAGTFEFSVDRRPPQRPRRTRALLGRGVDAASAGPAGIAAGGSSIPPAFAPLAVAGPVDSNGGRSSAAAAPVPAPARAPITNGFDMSMFSKPGEWKCGACLVKNPPGGDKCLSCETPKPGGGGGGDGQGGSAPSSGGGLLSSSGLSSSSTRFTFGAQPGGGAVGASSAAAPAAPAAGSVGSAPVKGGFDMSRFTTPGEWKCGSCLVKNGPGVRKCPACETPKPDSAGDAAGGDSGGLGGGAGAPATGSSLLGVPPGPSFVFGSQSTAAVGRPAEPPTAAPFTFGVQPGGGGGGGNVASSGATATSGGSAPAPAAAANGFDMSKFTKPGEWKCGSCLVRNGPGVTKCLSCETPKEGSVAAGGAGGGQAATSSGAPAFGAGAGSGSTNGGIVAAAPLSADVGSAHGTFSFGAAPTSSFSAAPAAGASNGSVFTFGAAAPTTAPAAPMRASGASTSASAPRFSFGAVDASASAAPATGAAAAGGFTFGAPSGTALPGAAAPMVPSSAASGVSFGAQPGQARFDYLMGPASSAAGNGGVQASGAASSAAPVFAFGSGSLPTPGSATTVAAAAPLFSFGAGSPPPPANPASSNSFNAPRAPLFSFGAGAGAPPAAGAAPSPAPTFAFGGGASAGGPPSSSSAAPGSSTAFNFTPRFTPSK